MAKKKVPINYTGRDFQSIKKDLVDYAKRYYPQTYKDFKEVSFGSLMMDTVAYVGDVLSFYIDYQANESFLDSAAEYNNVLRLSKQLGYVHRGNPSSSGIISFYIVVPANTGGMGPNMLYMPVLKKGSTFQATNGVTFILTENIDFSNPNNEVVVGRVDSITGVPLSYAIKASGHVISGKIVTQAFVLEDYVRFRRVRLAAPYVSEVLSVFDTDGNEYYQVDYLSHDVIYKEVTNRAKDRLDTPMVLRPYAVPRRFTLETEGVSSYLQFGFGSDAEDAGISPVEPSNFVLQMHARDYISDVAFDPSKLLQSNKLGVAPSQTTLKVQYRVNLAGNVNAPVGSLTRAMNPLFSFKDARKLDQGVVNNIMTSIETFNNDPILGDIERSTSEEIRIRTQDFFATQNRAVTKKDYEAIIYALPPKFGALKRCSVVQDPDSFKRNLNLYVLAEGVDGNLDHAGQSLKQNLKLWLSQYKMINDTIDILDGQIINIGIDFEIYTDPDVNKYDVLQSCVSALAAKYNEPLMLGEPFYISDIYTLLNSIYGVVDTKKVKITLRRGADYADSSLTTLSELMSGDGRYVSAPINAAFEIKFPLLDIKGAIR
jgi:hypothetical protein